MKLLAYQIALGGEPRLFSSSSSSRSPTFFPHHSSLLHLLLFSFPCIGGTTTLSPPCQASQSLPTISTVGENASATTKTPRAGLVRTLISRAAWLRMAPFDLPVANPSAVQLNFHTICGKSARIQQWLLSAPVPIPGGRRGPPSAPSVSPSQTPQRPASFPLDPSSPVAFSLAQRLLFSTSSLLPASFTQDHCAGLLLLNCPPGPASSMPYLSPTSYNAPPSRRLRRL